MSSFRTDEFNDSSTEFFGRWVLNRKLVLGVMGEFDLVLITEHKAAPFDSQMLDLATDLLGYCQANDLFLRDLLFAGYRRVLSRNPKWLDSSGVPRTVAKEQIAAQLRPRRWLKVSREAGVKPAYRSEAHLIPLWDTEHAFRLLVVNGKPVELNDSEEQLKALRRFAAL